MYYAFLTSFRSFRLFPRLLFICRHLYLVVWLVKKQWTRSKRYLKATNRKEQDICKPMSDEDTTLLMDESKQQGFVLMSVENLPAELLCFLFFFFL
jgi:hypothetical protein